MLELEASGEEVWGGQGGFMQKLPAWNKGDQRCALAIEDPQEPGRDIAGGTHRIADVCPPSLLEPPALLRPLFASFGSACVLGGSRGVRLVASGTQAHVYAKDAVES